MKFDGIEGESNVAGYETCLELISFSWGAQRAYRVVRSVGSEVGECTVSDAIVSRKADGKSAALLRETFYGQFDRTVTISFVRTGQFAPVESIGFMLEDCGISNYAIANVAEGDHAMETISLAFKRVSIRSFSIGDDLRAPPDHTSFDLVTGGR